MRALLPVTLALLAGCSRPTPPSAVSGAQDLDYPVGSFALTERSGATVTDKDLRGKVWVASFVFTRCTQGCPQVTATVARLQKELADQPDVRFVTFTVDPKRDKPAELQKYAEHFGADPGRWLFLTGDEVTLHTLIEKQFKQGVGEKPGPNVTPGQEFAAHSLRLAVVDKKGIVRGVYDGLKGESFPDADVRFEDNVRRLTERVRALAREP